MKAAAIIQARISSTRLHSKALLELCGMPMIFHVIERVKLIEGTDTVILATGSGSENSPLINIASQCEIKTFSGSEDDVLERYFMASQNIDCDYIIRVTGDNPLTDHRSASSALHYAYKVNADHCTTSGIPLGTGVEVIKKTALEQAYKEGKDPYHREHVTPYIKEHPELFHLIRFQSTFENPFPNLRLTVDTAEDYKLMQYIYNELYHNKPVELYDVINLIKNMPELRFINCNVQQRPMTHSCNG